MVDQQRALRRWRRGQGAAARRKLELLAEEGARPEVAVAESRSALNALEDMSGWAGRRDLVTESAVAVVRRRWARVQQRAKLARQG